MNQTLSRLVTCGNCKSRFGNNELVHLLFKYTNKDAHLPLVQSVVDGFGSYPLKQMKSFAYSLSTPKDKVGQILKRTNVPCPKCNKIHWL